MRVHVRWCNHGITWLVRWHTYTSSEHPSNMQVPADGPICQPLHHLTSLTPPTPVTRSAVTPPSTPSFHRCGQSPRGSRWFALTSDFNITQRGSAMCLHRVRSAVLPKSTTKPSSFRLRAITLYSSSSTGMDGILPFHLDFMATTYFTA